MTRKDQIAQAIINECLAGEAEVTECYEPAVVALQRARARAADPFAITGGLEFFRMRETVKGLITGDIGRRA